MWTFLIAGVLYLLGVGAVLYIRPTYMFTPDGKWKEFGIGSTDEKHTPYPFWLFCLTWAVFSYVSVVVFLGSLKFKNSDILQYKANTSLVHPLNAKGNDSPEELPHGYYMLNKKATKLSGFPKYMYIGPDGPEMPKPPLLQTVSNASTLQTK